MPKQSPVTHRLHDHLVSLDSTDPNQEHNDHLQISHIFDDRQVIGLGEATHGTREYFRLKHRLIKFFVEEFDLRAVALEADFPEASSINDYVLSGDGDPCEALSNIHLWPWNTHEVLDLIEWLRDFNHKRPIKDRTQFYGIDAQYTTGAVTVLQSFLKRADPEYLDRIDNILRRVDDAGQPPFQDDAVDQQLSSANKLHDELTTRFLERESEYMEVTDVDTYRQARRCIRIIDQALDRKRALREDNLVQAMTIRDRAMADNINWLLDLPEIDKVAIWAHNGHVNRLENRSNGKAAASMGAHLANEYGDGYYALGFEFGGGEFQALTAPSEDPEEGGGYVLAIQKLEHTLSDTIGRDFSAIGEPLFLFDVVSARTDPKLEEWLGTPSRLHSIGAIYRPDDLEYHIEQYPIGEAFDGLCYISNTTSTRPIQRG